MKHTCDDGLDPAQEQAGLDCSAQQLTKLAYSIDETSFVSSLGRSSIYAAIKAGRLKVVRIGRRTLVLAASLEALLRSDEN